MALAELLATKVQQSESDSLDLNIYLEMHDSVSNCLRNKNIKKSITHPLTLPYNVENQKPKEKSEKQLLSSMFDSESRGWRIQIVNLVARTDSMASGLIGNPSDGLNL